MALRLSALSTGRVLLRTNIIIFLLLVLISDRGRVKKKTQGLVRPEELGKSENAFTSSGLEPATSRLIA
jgi:hypothetical protein